MFTCAQPLTPEEPAPLPDDPFRDLVPIEVVRAASVYSETVAELVRKEIAALEEATKLAKASVPGYCCGGPSWRQRHAYRFSYIYFLIGIHRHAIVFVSLAQPN